MAERLTKEYYYTWDENGTKKLSYIQKLQNKLGKLEDILEKYGVESVEELDFRLAFKQNDVFNYKVVTELEQDRDTWKRACELACERFKQTGFIGDQTKVNYFYQQAKKERNDE